MRLRDEVSLLRRENVALTTKPASAATETVASQEDEARQLGLAVVRGDPGALDKLNDLAKSTSKSFNTDRVGLDGAQLEELNSRIFAPYRAAWKVIEEAAVAGNQVALEAVERAFETKELQSRAISVLGNLAGNGNEAALEKVVNPEKYGFLLSSSVFALRSSAEAGNQKAIDALAAVAKAERHQALWYSVATSLDGPAESGNVVAIDALIDMSVSTNKNIRAAVVPGLRKSAKQNARAAETLRSMGLE